MPIIVEGPTNTTVSVGENTIFTCSVSNISDSNITWLYHSTEHPSSINTSTATLKYTVQVSTRI